MVAMYGFMGYLESEQCDSNVLYEIHERYKVELDFTVIITIADSSFTVENLQLCDSELIFSVMLINFIQKSLCIY